MNKKLILLLSACTVGALHVNAQTETSTTTSTSTTTMAPAAPTPPPAPPAWAYSLSATYVSQYMFRGQRLGKDSAQGQFDATDGNWDLGIWADNPIGPTQVPGQSEPQINYYASYKYALNDSWSLQPGFTAYTFVKAPTNEGFYHGTFEPDIAANYTVGNLTLTPMVGYDVTLKGATYEGDATYAVPFKDWGTALDFNASIGTYNLYDAADHSKPNTRLYGDYWLLGVSAPYQLTKEVKLTVGYAYTEGSDAYFKQAGLRRVKDGAAQGKPVYSVSLTYAW